MIPPYEENQWQTNQQSEKKEKVKKTYVSLYGREYSYEYDKSLERDSQNNFWSEIWKGQQRASQATESSGLNQITNDQAIKNERVDLYVKEGGWCNII